MALRSLAGENSDNSEQAVQHKNNAANLGPHSPSLMPLRPLCGQGCIAANRWAAKAQVACEKPECDGDKSVNR